MMRPNQAETVLSVVSHCLVPQCSCTDVQVSLGCAVLLCLVCLFAFACFFLSSFSHLSLKHVHTYVESYT